MKYIIIWIACIVVSAFAIGQEGFTYVCGNSNITISASQSGSRYQWQINKGDGFVPLTEDMHFEGINSKDLQIKTLGTSISGWQFRCTIDSLNDFIFSMRVANIWIGSNAADWYNPSNWSCGFLPDSNCDVIIRNSKVKLNGIVKVKAVILEDSGGVILENGAMVEIAGKDFFINDFNLSAEDIDFLDSINVENPPLTDILGSDGVALNDINIRLYETIDLLNVKILTEKLLINAQMLSGAKILQFKGPYPDGINTELVPDQMGYGYRYGGDGALNARIRSTKGDNVHNKYYVLGTDCSGFIMHLMHFAGIPEYKYAITQADPKIPAAQPIIKQLQNDLQRSNAGRAIIAKDMGFLLEAEIKSGDIILWQKHVGLIAKTQSQKTIVFQSNGNPNPNSIQKCLKKDKNKNCIEYRSVEDEQLSNYSSSRGIQPKMFSDAINKVAGYWGTQYKIIRFLDFEITTTRKSTGKQEAVIEGEIKQDGGSDIIEWGICFTQNGIPTIKNNPLSAALNQTTKFTIEMKNLEEGKIYNVRTWAKNESALVYGNMVEVKPQKGKFPCTTYFLGMDGINHKGLWTNTFTVGDFTLATWFQLRDSIPNGKEMDLFHRDIYGFTRESLGLYIATDGSIQFRTHILKSSGANVQEIVQTGVIPRPFEWHHIAVSFEAAGIVHIYYDGILLTTRNLDGRRAIYYPYLDFLAVGCKYVSGGGGFFGATYKGWIDEVAFSAKVLSAIDIGLLMDGFPAGHPFLTEKLIYNYQKNDSYPQTVNSGIGSNSNAPIQGQLYYCPVNTNSMNLQSNSDALQTPRQLLPYINIKLPAIKGKLKY